MRRPFIPLAALAILSSVPAAAEDGLGFAVDLNVGIVVHHTTDAPFQEVTAYLCAENPSLGGVSGWECVVEVEGDAVGGMWTLADGLNVGNGDGDFQVGIGLDRALNPNGAGLVHLAKWTGFLPTPESVVRFHITPYPGSLSFEETAGYVGPDSATDFAPFTTPGRYTGQDFQINGENEAYQERSVSEVKESYR